MLNTKQMGKSRARSSLHVAGIAVALTTVSFLTSCAPVQRIFRDQTNRLPEVKLAFQIQAKPQGQYTLSGTTKLPENSRIAISAIRYLRWSDPSSLRPPGPPTPKTTYALLDYQETVVKKSQWQAKLNLWQVAKDGRFQEAWQRTQQDLGMPWQADPDVIFLATLVLPEWEGDRLQTVEAALRKQQLRLSPELVRSTVEGGQYFQNAQTQLVALPVGWTTPPPERPQDINGGWGRRYLIPPESPTPVRLVFPKERRTNAAGHPDEFLR